METLTWGVVVRSRGEWVDWGDLGVHETTGQGEEGEQLRMPPHSDTYASISCHVAP